MLRDFQIYSDSLNELKSDRILINTINAHSFNITNSDEIFKEALAKSDVLIPDGVSIVWAMRFLTGKKIKKIAGADLFFFEMKRIQEKGGKVFFLGSTDDTLAKIVKRVHYEFSKVEIQTYSPPYKSEFSEEDTQKMIQKVNAFNPDVLFVGMTAPKQEKWAYTNFSQLEIGHVCSIGAVFDFYAGTVKRAPQWIIKMGLEWFYRLLKEPKRMWKRYLVGNTIFILAILREKLSN
ncbi:WecB/TagA/CpsF family glycosyltransferase [uncultured Polaribacter sp.]|jgi:N-acetylglucosaminyldiphosphoundecaprenol N-acetyl-beta-D-mannosaminyltransferase|uniref:WecB/TagA/CpsF family glycosyltransferase n=1 Tax=uncultured Polaribacter sp. TaxID=174711 RepID=UPI00260E947D|nr:WecB/TagA/CpsF family glycosyltransferase [uncultured Polaribacter sp.]